MVGTSRKSNEPAMRDSPQCPDEWQAEIEAENKRKAARAKREAARAKREAKEKIAAFIAGADVSIPHIVEESYARIEIEPVSCAKVLATSKGAVVPLAHVKRVWPTVKKLIEKGREFHANGKTLHVGHYQITEIKTDGTLIAGCHRFERTEVLRIGSLVESKA